MRVLVSPSHSFKMRAAKFLAASTYVTSFSSVNACCGVFERVRSATHSSWLGASKFNSEGFRNVRCHHVYNPRRYKLSPWSWSYLRLGKFKNSQYPSG